MDADDDDKLSACVFIGHAKSLRTAQHSEVKFATVEALIFVLTQWQGRPSPSKPMMQNF